MGLAAFYVVADGVHEVGLAHADAAVEEEGVVGLGRALGDGLGEAAMANWFPRADDEGVELISGVELGCVVPVEAGLLGRGEADLGGGSWAAWAGRVEAVAWEGREAAVLADAGRGGVLLRESGR